MGGMLGALRAAVLSGLLTYASVVAAAPINQIVVFGDSLADAGNNAIVLGSITPIPIASPAFIPTFPYASGRYSDGPVWVEQFAQALGLEATASLAGGSDFAFGGARTGPAGSDFPFSLIDQLGMYLSTTGGVAQQDTLYIVSGGGNDARDAFAAAALGGDPAPFIEAYATNMGALLTGLDAAGAEHIVLTNVPDIGKTPAVRALGDVASAGGTAIAAMMNIALAGVLSGLPDSLLDDLLIIDAFALVGDIFANPQAHGLSNVTDPCAFIAECIAGEGTYFWWDGIHPTRHGHGILAQAVLAQLQAVPAPATVLLILQGMGLMAWMRRRSRPA